MTQDTIEPNPTAQPAAGGVVIFEGKVRNEHRGREVVALEYDAFDDLAIAEGERLLQEAVQTFGLCSAQAVHRKGRLVVGETAVWIEVSAPHRHEAFAACEFVIDELKKRVPIWKKEHYADGDSGWIGCEDDKPVSL